MPLQPGEVRGYHFNRSVVEFTMLNQGNVILCAISTAAMDGLEGRRDVRPDQRVDQFIWLREVIEERAFAKVSSSKKFLGDSESHKNFARGQDFIKNFARDTEPPPFALGPGSVRFHLRKRTLTPTVGMPATRKFAVGLCRFACSVRSINTARMIATRKSAGTSPIK